MTSVSISDTSPGDRIMMSHTGPGARSEAMGIDAARHRDERPGPLSSRSAALGWAWGRSVLGLAA